MAQRIFYWRVVLMPSLLLNAIVKASNFCNQVGLAQSANLEARLTTMQFALLGDAQLAETN